MKNYYTVIIFAAFLINVYVKISGKEHESTFGALWDTGSHFGALWEILYPIMHHATDHWHDVWVVH